MTEQFEYAWLDKDERVWGDQYTFQGERFDDGFISTLNKLGGRGWEFKMQQDGGSCLMMRRRGVE